MSLEQSHKIWIMAGESSGDLYGAELAKELKSMDPAIKLQGMGGSYMRDAGVDIMVDSSELGVVGILEVVKSIPFFLKLINRMAKKAIEERPDAVVLIDYPGFNLRLAEKLHNAGIRVVYYISPQVWAWKKNRIPKIAKWVDRMLCIFPFEPVVYSGTNLRADFVGHPLLEILKSLREQEKERDENLILLLPGSRTSELKAHLKVFIESAAKLLEQRPGIRFAMPLPREKTLQTAERIIDSLKIAPEVRASITLSVGNARELMKEAMAGLAASGTVTVEAAMLGLPLVVAYRVNWLTYQIAKRLVKLPSITIANLVTGHCVYEERLQYDATPEKIVPAVLDIMPGGARRGTALDGIKECVSKLGEESKASRRVAEEVLDVIKTVRKG